jgi:serine/threonine-protein kinase
VTEEQSLGVGAEIAGFVIDGVLGQGGMGVVYAATHPVIGKRAAIKVLRPELSRDARAVERFIGEARAVNQIGHPNIVDIFTFGQLPDGRSYYIMDLLVGETLRHRLARGPLHISEAASVIDETASALLAAHAKNIIHRDLKPDNVFMVTIAGRWPEVKLLDWGLAKLGVLKPSTLAGQVIGTPVYMSPEQARGSDVDHRTDIYALGVMSYELLSGAAPFKKSTSIDTLVSHQEDPVPPLRVVGVPEQLAQLIEAMLAKEPDDRPTLQAIRAVLKRLRGTTIPTMSAAGLEIGALPHGEVHFEPVRSEQITGRNVPMPPPRLSSFHTTTPGYSMAQIQQQSRGSYTSLPLQTEPPPPPVEPAPPRGSRRRWLLIAVGAAIVISIAVTVVLVVF